MLATSNYERLLSRKANLSISKVETYQSPNAVYVNRNVTTKHCQKFERIWNYIIRSTIKNIY